MLPVPSHSLRTERTRIAVPSTKTLARKEIPVLSYGDYFSQNTCQLPILLISQVNVLASPRPRSDRMIETLQRGIFGLTACHERPEAVQRVELEIARSRAEAGAAVVLYEVNVPAVAVVVEVQQNAGHGDSID